MKDKQFNKNCNKLFKHLSYALEEFLNEFKMKEVSYVSTQIVGAVLLHLITEHYKYHYALRPKAINDFINHIRDELYEIMEEETDKEALPFNLDKDMEILEDLGAEA